MVAGIINMVVVATPPGRRSSAGSLGANDGILSTANLVLGVAAAHGTRNNVLVARVAGLVAGAMSMAAGEYVSVHSQADTEQADLARERAELRTDDAGEQKELTAIYVGRGLEQEDGENWDQSTRAARGMVGQRYPLNFAMNLGRGTIQREASGLAHIEPCWVG